MTEELTLDPSDDRILKDGFESWAKNRPHWTPEFEEAYSAGILDQRQASLVRIRELEALIAKPKWEPIETAPRPKGSPTKTIIGTDGYVTFEAYWSELSQEFHCCGGPVTITKWMNFPAPPALDSEVEAS